MVTSQGTDADNGLYYRLITFWVVCEAFAGGLMHAVKIPFAGMAINSLAVICIILIASYIRKPRAILQATIIVCIFKFILSPHSPPTAYIAVGFQGLMGALLFRRAVTKGRAIALATVTLVESSLQRLLVLLIIYGNEFWGALNIYINKLTGENEVTNYSLLLAGIYILIHALTGIFIGSYSYSLVKNSDAWAASHPGYLFDGDVQGQKMPDKVIRKKSVKFFLVFTWLLLIAFAMHSILEPKTALMARSEVFRIIVRAGLILTSWQLVISPLLKALIRKILRKEKGRNRKDVEAVSELLPEIKFLFFESWRRSYELKGFQRLKLAIRIMLANLLQKETRPRINP